MRIIAVDDDSTSLKKIQGYLSKAAPEATCYYFDSSLAALAKAREEEIDVDSAGMPRRRAALKAPIP